MRTPILAIAALAATAVPASQVSASTAVEKKAALYTERAFTSAYPIDQNGNTGPWLIWKARCVQKKNTKPARFICWISGTMKPQWNPRTVKATVYLKRSSYRYYNKVLTGFKMTKVTFRSTINNIDSDAYKNLRNSNF